MWDSALLGRESSFKSESSPPLVDDSSTVASGTNSGISLGKKRSAISVYMKCVYQCIRVPSEAETSGWRETEVTRETASEQ